MTTRWEALGFSFFLVLSACGESARSDRRARRDAGAEPNFRHDRARLSLDELEWNERAFGVGNITRATLVYDQSANVVTCDDS